MKTLAPALLALLLSACAPLPVGAPGAHWQPSPNVDERRPNFIILHQTTNNEAGTALRTLTDPLRQVSAHYLIERDGTLHQLVDERRRAWHAGLSWWGGTTDLNSASIGIELDNTGDEPFAAAQIATLLGLLDQLRARHRIPAENVLGHGDVALRRKVDPSPLFPWAQLAERGHGLWCQGPPSPAPAGFDAQLGLAALGYDPADAEAARAAFRRHFLAADSGAPLEGAEVDLLHCLLQARRRPPAPPNGMVPELR